MPTLEDAVRQAWVAWGEYAQWNTCGGCGEFRYCRRARRGPWLCLDCFDQR